MLGLLGWLAPRVVRPFYIAAMLAAFPIGWVVSWLTLGLVYYGVFTPLALGFRLAGRDVLGRRKPRATDSYWTPKPAPDDPGRYLRQY